MSQLADIISVLKKKVDSKPLSFHYKIYTLVRVYFGGMKGYKYGYWLKFNKKSCEPIYYIIRNPMRQPACVLKTYIYQYSWAKKNGLIPVMDLEPISVYDKKEIGVVENLWELAFEQEISVQDALKQDNVYISDLSGGPKDFDLMNRVPTVQNNYSKCPSDIREFEKYRKYRPFDLQLNKKIVDSGELFCKEHQLEKKRVLAVYMREQFSLGHYIPREDYEGTILTLHPLIPTIDDCITYVKETVDVSRYDTIFLATECEDTIQAFKESFNGMEVLYIPRKRKSLNQMISSLRDPQNDSLYPSSFLHEEYDYRDIIPDYEDFKEKNSKYMLEIYIIAKCNSLIAAPSNAIITVAMIKNDCFETFYKFHDEHIGY